ncbi:MAG: endonuclease III [Nitrososphaeria archaeon]|nr:endonuclease III [Nitrososphaeria archaeon]
MELSKIIKRIVEEMKVEKNVNNESAFETLVTTIISQNTNDKNTMKAVELLKKEIGLNIESILSAKKEKIIECLKPAGLYNVKAPRIIELAKKIKYELGDERKLDIMDDEEIKEFLSKVKGIGPKTIDIFLAFKRKRNIIPVDTHVSRVSKRLEIADKKDKYFEIRRKLEEIVPEEERLKTHFALIMFGRKICKAKKPRCMICPVKDDCPSSKQFLSS